MASTAIENTDANLIDLGELGDALPSIDADTQANSSVASPSSLRPARDDQYSDQWDVRSVSDIAPNEYHRDLFAAQPMAQEGTPQEDGKAPESEDKGHEGDKEGTEHVAQEPAVPALSPADPLAAPPADPSAAPPATTAVGIPRQEIQYPAPPAEAVHDIGRERAAPAKQWSLWDDEEQRRRAMKKHQHASAVEAPAPGLFEHGIRYVRHHLPDTDTLGSDGGRTRRSRALVIGNLPDRVELGAVLEHIQGEVIKAMVVHVPGGFGPKAAFIYFRTADQARNMYELVWERGLYMADGNDTARKATAVIADTETYPMSRQLDDWITNGRTRVLNVKGKMVDWFPYALHECGLRTQFGNMIADVRLVAEGHVVVEFGSVQVASRVFATMRRVLGMLNGENRNGNGNGNDDDKDKDALVFFSEDPCADKDRAVLEGQPPYPSTTSLVARWGHLLTEKPHSPEPLPPSFDKTSSLAEAAGPVLNETAGDRANRFARQLLASEQLDPSRFEDVQAPTQFMEATADWDGDHIERRRGLNHEGRWCLVERDPLSGAEQFRELAGNVEDGEPAAHATQYRGDFVREWLHYNLHTDFAFIQETMDLYFKSNGLQNQRRLAQYVRLRDERRPNASQV